MSLRHVLSTIKATGLACDPPEPAPGWRESAL